MIKAICAFVTATGSELSLSFSIFIMGSNLHPYSQKSIGHLSKEADVNDYSTERQKFCSLTLQEKHKLLYQEVSIT